MNDLGSLTAQPTRLSLGGEAFDLHPLTIADFGRLQAWVDAQFPNPFDVVGAQISRGRVVENADGTTSRVPFTVEQERYLYRLAGEMAVNTRRLIGTPEGDSVLRSLAGVLEQLYLSISKGDPTFTRERAAALVENLSLVEINRVMSATTVDLVAGEPDPKARPGTTGGPNPTATPGGTTTLSGVSAGRPPKGPTGGPSSAGSRTPTSGRRKRSGG